MASVTPSEPILQDRADTERRIRHPLQALRGYIRTYVLLEGLAVAILFLALWFWITLALDYGLFAIRLDAGLFAVGWFDWIKTLDRNFEPASALTTRRLLLGLIVVAFLVVVLFKVVRRLLVEFSDRSLALVLERRFPQLLGDRLITAVELANPKVAEKYGFSQDMVDYTIRTAAQRVGQLPIRDVFNWSRLYRQWGLVFACTFGIYLLVMGTTMGYYALATEIPPTAAFSDFNRVSSIWSKRQALLQPRVYWPTRSYVEVVRFQESAEHPGQMRVARDQSRPDVKARAYEWVIFDPDSPEGVRPLKIADLPDWLDEQTLAVPLPADWPHWLVDLDNLDSRVPNTLVEGRGWDHKKAGYVRQQLYPQGERSLVRAELEQAGALQAVDNLLDWHAWSVDELVYQLDEGDVRRAMRDHNPKALQAFETLLERLEDLAGDRGNNWTVRRLTIPAEVSVYYRGDKTKSSSTHPRQPGNKYLIGLNELKESVRFWVQGENFFTPPRWIELVPPPGLQQLHLHKEEPAYLYYRLQGEPAKLKGETQVFHNIPVNPSAPFVRITDVSVGAKIELTGQAARKLKEGVRVEAVPKGSQKTRGGQVPAVPVRLDADGITFHLALEQLTQPQEFLLLFTDLDNVEGRRHIVIEPKVDAPPVEDRTVELTAVLRKPRIQLGSTSSSALDGYLITPEALLPFQGIFRDDQGLAKLDWLYEYEPVEFELLTERTATTGNAAKTTRAARGPKSPVVERAAAVVSGFQTMPGGLGQSWLAPLQWPLIGRYIQLDLAEAAQKIVQERLPLERFQNKTDLLLNQHAVTWQQFQQRRTGPAPAPFLLQSWLLDQEEGFDVRKNLPKLKSKEAQLHYRLTLQTAATDSNIESGPGVTLSRSPVTFLVVSENELLAQILLQEEEIRERLEKAVQKLRDGKTALEDQIGKLSDTSQLKQISLVGLRVDEIRKAAQESATVAREAHTDYRRILQELEINRVQQDKIDNVRDSIVRPLEEITNLGGGNFTVTEDALTRLWENLETDVAMLKGKAEDDPALQGLLLKNQPQHLERARASQVQLNLLIQRLEEVLEAMTGELSWGELVRSAVEIERDQRTIARNWSEQHRRIEERIFQDLLK